MPLRTQFLRSTYPTQKARWYSRIEVDSFVRLSDLSIVTFRKLALEPALPAILPGGFSNTLPAIDRWFETGPDDSKVWRLKTSYLSQFAETTVPLELTQCRKTPPGSKTTFDRFEASLGHFMRWSELQANGSPNEGGGDLCSTRLYLAQASLSDLPQKMNDDLPVPHIVKSSGRGDVYASNIWIGVAPTVTALHKDPNPNLFIQLAGRKVVRLYEPDLGLEMFRAAQTRIHGNASAAFRGSEMMQGPEKEVLEEIVWGQNVHCQLEAHLESGDAIFIPKGWWHSIKGIGKGITASVNWWFR